MSNYNMMTCAECDELFPDFFESSVSQSDTVRFDDHVSTCVRCQALIRDIDGIRAGAASLPELTPSHDLWTGIAARIQPEVRSIATYESKSRSRTWLAAAAAALIVASSGVTYLATSHSGARPGAAPNKVATIVEPPQVAMATPERQSRTQPVARPAIPRTSFASSSPAPVPTASELAFAGEISELQSVLVQRRNQLDPETVKVVEDNLKLIDTAVSRARAALAKDPASGFLTRQLDGALQKKVDLLRTMALLPAIT